MDVRAALKGQYRAALAMLKQTIESCPEELWDGGRPQPGPLPVEKGVTYAVPFWRVVYHTLYATHLYLQTNEAAFRPWEHHREECNELPWPPGSGAKIDDPYTKPQMLEYWRVVDAMVDEAVDRLDLHAKESGFSWHKTMPKFEHQIHNIRHIQHHTALLSGRLRLANGTDIRWVRTNQEIYKG